MDWVRLTSKEDEDSIAQYKATGDYFYPHRLRILELGVVERPYKEGLEFSTVELINIPLVSALKAGCESALEMICAECEPWMQEEVEIQLRDALAGLEVK